MAQAKGIPRYQLVADTLRQQIASEAYPYGSQLPSEPMLSQTFGVSRGTVVKAIEQLVSEGLAVRRQGAGTFVARASLRREPGRLQSFTETVAAQGRAAAQSILSYSPADKDHCASLGCFEPAMELSRLRLVDGVEAALHRCFVPTTIMDRLSDADQDQLRHVGVTDFSLYASFEAAGIEIVSATEFVTARLANRTEIELLKLSEPSAVMVITRKSLAADGRLIEVTEAAYPAEHYTYETSLLRGTSRPVPIQLREPT